MVGWRLLVRRRWFVTLGSHPFYRRERTWNIKMLSLEGNSFHIGRGQLWDVVGARCNFRAGFVFSYQFIWCYLLKPSNLRVKAVHFWFNKSFPLFAKMKVYHAFWVQSAIFGLYNPHINHTNHPFLGWTPFTFWRFAAMGLFLRPLSCFESDEDQALGWLSTFVHSHNDDDGSGLLMDING